MRRNWVAQQRSALCANSLWIAAARLEMQTPWWSHEHARLRCRPSFARFALRQPRFKLRPHPAIRRTRNTLASRLLADCGGHLDIDASGPGL